MPSCHNYEGIASQLSGLLRSDPHKRLAVRAWQKLVTTAGIERMWQLGAQIGAIKPEALDRLDADGAMDAYADMTGAPASVLVDRKKAEQARQARAQAQQQQVAFAGDPVRRHAPASRRAPVRPPTGSGSSTGRPCAAGAQSAAAHTVWPRPDPPRGVDRQGRPEPAPNRSSSEGYTAQRWRSCARCAN